jgi:DNA-binding SARP family transcriptional activator
VAADADLDAADVLDTIAALVDKSLVGVREEAGTARFALLETIRQYASAKLKESGGFHRVCSRHAKAYLDLAEEAAPHLITRGRPEWMERIHRELDNIRLALACTREDDIGAHLRFQGNLGWFWYSSGLWTEGRRWLESAITLHAPDAARSDRARVLFGAGVLASLQGDTATAVAWLDECAPIFRSVGDESGEAYALAYLGVAWGLINDDRAEAPAMQALAHFRKSGDLYGLRLCLVVLSTFNAVRGRIDVAKQFGEEAVDVARAYGLDRELAIALQVFGQVSLASGDVARAGELFRECVAALRRDPSLFWTARALRMLALVHFRMSINERGAFLMGASDAVRESIGAGLIGHDRALVLPAIDKARSEIGAGAFDAAMNAGRTAPLDTVLDRVVRESDTGEFPVPRPAARAPMPHPPLEVRALGPLEILRDGKPVPDEAWRSARPRELLLYLLSHPDGCTREQIGLAFWPDASTTQVKNNFHVMLHHVRKALGRSDLIAFERDRYRIAWELAVTFDAREFEQRARAGLRTRGGKDEDLQAAVALYRGEFLAEADAGDWHLETRDALRRLYLDVVLQLGQRAMGRDAYKEAADWFRKAVAADPLYEEANRSLMLALSRAGDRAEAMRSYNRLAQTLQKDMDAQPDRETKALYERLRRAEPV